MNAKEIGVKLRTLRGTRTLGEVAENCGISKQALSNYESGYRIPRDVHKMALAKFYETTVEALFFA